MVSGGLGWTDYGKKEVIGGYSLEFFQRVGAKYGARRSNGISSRTSPRPCSTIWSRKPAFACFLQHRPSREERRRRRPAPRVDELVTENGDDVSARVFADASYEGRSDGAGRRVVHVGP